MMRNLLVFTPVASHPSYQGNSALVFRVTKLFQEAGYQVHFFYYLQEGLTEKQREDMRNCWEHVYFHPIDWSVRKMSRPEYFLVDDWWEPALGDSIEALCRQWSFDVVLVNYIWQSKLLERISGNSYKIILTHDVFGNRHLGTIAAGLKPTWFWTIPEQEGLALDRADAVIAVQEQEAEYFRTITRAEVFDIGYLLPPCFVTHKRGERLRVGYIASDNAWNCNSFYRLHEELARKPGLRGKVEFVVAGPICRKIEGRNQYFVTLGVVPRIEDFYQRIDVCINPMVGGSGVKIKSIEAMGYGVAFVGTVDSTTGMEIPSPEHRCSTLAELCQVIDRLADDDRYLSDLRRRTRQQFMRYRSDQLDRFDKLRARIENWMQERRGFPSDNGPRADHLGSAD